MTHKNFKTCTSCVMDESSPDIKFNTDGVCNYCTAYRNKISGEEDFEKNLKILEKIAVKIKNHSKRLNKKYDCLIGVSGGLDSSYLVYYVVTKLNLKPLLFHVDAGWNSSVSANNIEKLVDNLKLDLVTHVVDWDEMKDLHLAYFKSGVPSLDNIQDHAFFGAMYQYVEKENIKFILTGANFATEFIRAPLDWAYHASDTKQILDIHKKHGTIKLKEFPLYDIFRSKFYLKIFKQVKIIYPLNYINYDKKKAESILEEKFQWQKYPKKHHESRFTAFYENYWSLERFGHDRRKLIYSGMILSNQMNRSEALKLLKNKPLDDLSLNKEINYVCNKLDISRSELNNFFNLKRKSFHDYKSNFFLINFFTKILNFLNVEKRIF